MIPSAGKYQQARTVVDRETGDDHTAYGRWCVEFRTQENAGDVQIYDTIGVMVATDLSVPKAALGNQRHMQPWATSDTMWGA